jgi:biopolymer transport protein ExbD
VLWIALFVAAFPTLGLAQNTGPTTAPNRLAAPAAAASAPQAGFPFIRIDAARRRIEVDCEALNVDIPVEFFCVQAGGNEHESILRTQAKASHIHAALLILGLTPGGCVHYDQVTHVWSPPYGPALNISCRYVLNGKETTVPAYRLMRQEKTKVPMPPMSWVFAGSKVMDDGTYAADITSYVVSMVNFDYTLIDIPALASNANETLQWERDPAMLPPTGSAVTMILEPVATSATTRGSPATGGLGAIESIATAQVSIDATGNIELDHRKTTAADLVNRLREKNGRGPFKVVLRADPDSPASALQSVIQAIAAAGVDVELPATTRPAAAR